MQDRFSNIENNIDIQSFIYKGENLWPIFRKKIGDELVVDEFSVSSNKNNKINKLTFFLIFIKGLFNIVFSYRNCSYIFLTDSDDYRFVNKVLLNRLTNEFSLNMKKDKILEIQSTLPLKKSTNLTNTRYVSSIAAVIFIKVISGFIKVAPPNKVLISELKKFNIRIDPKAVIKEYLAYSLWYKLIFRLVKPKVLVTTCYSFLAAVRVAKSLGIKTLEVQHGNVASGDYAYTITKDIGGIFYPEYMAVSGIADKLFLEKVYYVRKLENIFPVGNLMISMYKNKSHPNIFLLRETYSKIIAVTLQWTVTLEVVSYIKKQALLNPTYCFILIPRNKEDLPKNSAVMQNIKVFLDLNCYEIIASADYHLTVSSTCAREAPSLGIKNIFYNYKNMSNLSYQEYISSKRFNIILEENQSIAEAIQCDTYIDKEGIMTENNEFVSLHYKDNIKKITRRLCK